jgi:hypothetical protein
MDTVKLMQWREEFDAIMTEEYLDNRIADTMRDLHRRTSEQDDMWEEPAETETERML